MRNFNEGLADLEYKFNELFKDQIEIIQFFADDDPLTLEEVLTMGFNNVVLGEEKGYEKEDFSKKALKTKVDFDYWEEDLDFYRTVYLVKAKGGKK